MLVSEKGSALTFLLLTFFILAIGVSGYYVVFIRNGSTSNVLRTINTSQPSQSLIPDQDDIMLKDSPPKNPNLSWQSIPKNLSRLGKSAVVYEISNPDTMARVDVRGIDLEGKEYIAEQNFNQLEKFQKALFDDMKYYDNEAPKKGWVTTINQQDFRLYTNLADGPGNGPNSPAGHIWGYLKLENNNLRALVLKEEFNSASLNGEVQKCPCHIKYKYFISEVISLNKLKMKAFR